MSSIVTPSVVGWGRGSPTVKVACAADTARVLPTMRTALSTAALALVYVSARELSRTRRAKVADAPDVVAVIPVGCTRRRSPALADVVAVAVAESRIAALTCRLAAVAVTLTADSWIGRASDAVALPIGPSPAALYALACTV